MAISIPQPLPWIIFHANLKDPLRLVNLEFESDYRGLLWIHAAQFDEKIANYVEKELKVWWPKPSKHWPQRFKVNGYVGFANAIACVKGSKSRWSNQSKWQMEFSGVYPMPHIPFLTEKLGVIFPFQE